MDFVAEQSVASLTKRATLKGCSFAEGEGFKPPIPERGIPDFESSAIDHSANLPDCSWRINVIS